MRRLVGGRRRATAAGLAVAAAALAAAGARSQGGAETRAAQPDGPPSAPSAPASGVHGDRARLPDPGPSPAPVSAPVRIADAATVRLLRPGDRVDVVASQQGSAPPRTVAEGARVQRLPEPVETDPVDGALVVLAVPRRTATKLAGAAVTSRLAVTLR